MERILADLVRETSFVVRRDVLNFMGGAFKVSNLLGEPLFYVRIAFNWRGDLHFLDGRQKEHELMVVSPRRAFDPLAIHDVTDIGRQEKVGMIQKKPHVRAWALYDQAGREVGAIVPDRRGLFVTRTYRGVAGQTEVCHLRRHISPLVPAMTAEFPIGAKQDAPDRRLSLAAVLLVCAARL